MEKSEKKKLYIEKVIDIVHGHILQEGVLTCLKKVQLYSNSEALSISCLEK